MIFESEFIRHKIIEVFGNIALEFKITLHGIVIATDHIHVIVTLPEPERISLGEYISRAKIRITQTIKGRAGPPLRDEIWQRSFYDHVIRNENDFLEKARYVENHLLKEEGDICSEWH